MPALPLHTQQPRDVCIVHFILAQSLGVLFFLFFSPYSLQTRWTAFKWRWVVCWRSCTVLIRKFQGFSREAWQRQKIISSLSVCNQSCLSFQLLACLFFVVSKWPLKIYFFVSCQVFLSSELQAAQIMKSRRVLDKEGSPVCQELLVICNTLSLPQSKGQDTAGVFSQVQDRVGLFNGVEAH